MNQVVFILDTGCAAVYEMAEWFLKHRDRVILGVEKLPEKRIAEAEYLEIDSGFEFQNALPITHSSHPTP